MRELAIAFTLSIWPMRWTAGYEFDEEVHTWWAAAGPFGVRIYYEPRT